MPVNPIYLKVISFLMLIDTHAHLHFRNFNKDREQVIERAREVLEAVFEAGVDLNTNNKALALAEEHSGFIHPVIGLHPTEKLSEDSCAKVEAQIRENVSRIIAIGEIGLDYYHDTPRDIQRHVFERMLSLAESLSLPVIVHSREAESDCLDILSAYRLPKVVMHCFSHLPLVGKCIEQGYLVSVPTTVCFSENARKIAEKIPLSGMLLETDAPFLSPLRGKRNEPAFLVHSIPVLSKLLNKKPDEISLATTSNARALL